MGVGKEVGEEAAAVTLATHYVDVYSRRALDINDSRDESSTSGADNDHRSGIYTASPAKE